MKMTHKSKKYWDKLAITIDKMMITKKRYVTIEFLRKIIVLQSMYAEEKVRNIWMKKDGKPYSGTIENHIIDYDPERLSDLAVKLYPELKEIANVTSGWYKEEPINVTPDWIKNVLIVYNELNVNPVLYSIAKNLPE